MSHIIKYTAIILVLTIPTFISAQERLSWLPSDKGEKIILSPKVEDFLSPLNGHMRILGCEYEESRLIKSGTIGKEGLPTTSGKWICDLKTTPVKGNNEGLGLTFSFKHDGGDINSSGIAVAFDFGRWDIENYVLIPASVYNGNRNRIVKRDYNEGLDRSDLYRPDFPQTTTELPQLSPNPNETSRIEVHTSNTTTPAICFWDKKTKQGFIVLTEQGIQHGDHIIDNGFIVEENADRTAATLVVNIPGVREKKPEFVGFSKSPDRGITWRNGEEREIKMEIYRFPAEDIPTLLDKFTYVRKSVTGKNSPRNLIPMSETLHIMCGDIDKRYYEGKPYEFYCPENAEWISYGWIGGLMNTFPMLALGDATHRSRVKHTFDFGLELGQGKSGYYYGALNKDGKPFGREGYDDHPEIVLTRKNGDVLFWTIKQFFLLRKQEHSSEINPEWEERVKKLANAFVSTWEKHGQWGNHLNHETGGIAVFNTSSGVSAIGGLALASKYYHNDTYMQTAIKASEYYYKEFAKQGMTTGGCADILQNSDSETAAAFMTSLMTIFELTGETKWLEMSRNLANLCATWTTSFDYQLPPDTPLAKLGAKLAGAVWASTQNKHGAPGFCTLSGDALFKIYRMTGDERYAELMRDIIHAHAEGIQPNGHITERLTYCDADSRGSRGDGGKTGWNETNGAMMALEIPGIYVQTDGDLFFVFDHVEAKVIERKKGKVLLEITNPTKYDASVSILTESRKKATDPIGVTGFTDWPKVHIKAGETIQHWSNILQKAANIK